MPQKFTRLDPSISTLGYDISMNSSTTYSIYHKTLYGGVGTSQKKKKLLLFKDDFVVSTLLPRSNPQTLITL